MVVDAVAMILLDYGYKQELQKYFIRNMKVLESVFE